jgi:hypothetical protein
MHQGNKGLMNMKAVVSRETETLITFICELFFYDTLVTFIIERGAELNASNPRPI